MTASAARLGAPTVVGAACWTLTVAYLLVQPVVAAAWPTPYDLATNSISDLGVTGCGDLRQFDDRAVYACSPRHALMNTVFVLVGVLTAAGALLTRAIWPRRRLTSVGVAFVVLAGVGGILVGLAPANVNLAAHAAGALLQVPGAVGPLLLGVAAWSVQRPVAAFSLLCGVVGSAASVLYLSQIYLGLGPGSMEHLAFDPLTSGPPRWGRPAQALAGSTPRHPVSRDRRRRSGVARSGRRAGGWCFTNPRRITTTHELPYASTKHP